MIKKFILWLLREELADIRDENEADIALLHEKLRTQREHLVSSVQLSFVTIKSLIDKAQRDADDALVTSKAAFDEIELLSGAHEHLDDTVQGICEELNKDHDTLGVLFDDLLFEIEDLSERLDELEG